MRNPLPGIWKHQAAFWAALAVIATLLGGLAFFVPMLRTWLEAHGLLGWGLSLGLLAIVAVLIKVLQAGDPVAPLAGPDPPTSQPPSKRDVEQFSRLLKLWAWDKEPMGWIDGFTAKRWRPEQIRPVHFFVEEWREVFFDDPQVQKRFAEFRDAVSRLSQWAGGESFPQTDSQGNLYHVVPISEERTGGWKEFEGVKGEGLSRSAEVVSARRELERVGRARGL